MLDQLIGAVRAGESRPLVVHGEPGVGKTALLDYVGVQALGYHVLRGSGVQSEMELPFAGLHQLCAPLLAGLDMLPQPQREALRTAFGMSAGITPDRFLVGLAVLGLLSDAAQERPLMCLVDDYQWLDRTSAQVLAFVARRLGTEAVGLIVATRVVDGDLGGLPALEVGGLRPADAGALLDTVLVRPVDAQVRDRIIAETRGNPLALLELPRGLTPAELAGGFGLPGAVTLSSSIEGSFAREVGALPDPSRRLLLVAAADPSGDPALVWRAAALLGIGPDAGVPAAEAGLVELGVRIRFRHPLTRSAVYRSASPEERRQIHRALAEATDSQSDPDRRAWHRAQAVSGTDEEVAAELEHSANRARARGGLAAAAAFLLRTATLTLDPAKRAARALAAAETHIHAGALDTAHDLLAMADTEPLDDRQRAQADMIRAQLAFVTNRGSDAPPLLLKAATRLGPVDPGLSRATHLDAVCAAIFAGRLAGEGAGVLEIARAARAAPPPSDDETRVPDLLLDGTLASYTHGYAAGLPSLRAALAGFGTGMSAEEELHWLFLATTTTLRLWDDGRWDTLSARHVQLARELGSLTELPLALTTRGYMLLFAGDLDGATALAGEAQAIGDATGATLAPYGALGVAAFRGDAAAVSDLHEAALRDVTRRGEGVGITFAEWARALLGNGLGHYDDALSAAQRGTAYAPDPGSLIFPAVELFEAAARTDQVGAASEVFDRFTEMTTASGTDWALGLQARSQALLTVGDAADGLYRDAIAHLGRTRLRAELARTHLLYGEWLRRMRRHNAAREQLRTAHTMLESMGMTAFAERANRELRAAGGAVRKRTDASRYDELTAQETQIARMARDGLSNPEIASRLFISAHTVQYHLRKVFTKLGVTSRSQLDRALPDSRGA
ncbi:LuxR family transcriptional regulator [Pseudonocardia zijingensis]|uniref:LuxR family transcriptional regulator n=1 Tax=Pseudonocardia zijingensis TaxID=153376 RepID=A0ABN1NGS8_9PSEU